MVRIVGLNKKYFPQSNPLDKILTPEAQAVINRPKVANPVARPTSMDTVSYDRPSVISTIRDSAKIIAEGVRGGYRFAKRIKETGGVRDEIKIGLDLGVKQTTNSILGFLSRPKQESNLKSLQGNEALIVDWETKIAPKLRNIIAKNQKIIAETPRSFPTNGLSFSQKIKDPRFVFGGAAQQIPNVGAVVATGLATGGVGALGMGFILESQNAYEDAKAKGVSEDQARSIGAGVGMVNSVLEVLPVLKFLDKTPAGQRVKRSILKEAQNIITKTGTQALEEGGTEFLQEVTANAFAKIYDENRGLFDNAPESGFFGALTGGGIGAGGAVVSPNIGLTTENVDPLEEEAKKYKSAEEFVKAKTTRPDYGYGHSPNENGVRAFDLTEKVDGEQMIPKDMYERWYGSRGTPEDLESISVLKKVKGNPEAEVTIYRASPKDEWNYGDWITLSKKYAQTHAEGNNLKVFSKKVKAKDIRWAMDDVNEFGYFPESTKSQLTDIWNKANKPKTKPVPLQEKINKANENLARLGFERDNLDTKFDSVDLENQYQEFKKLVTPKKLDTIADDVDLKSKVKAGPEQIDNILYNQELNASEVFNMFKERRYQELSQRGEKGRIAQEERTVKKELTKLEKVAKVRQEKKELVDRVKSIYDKQVAKIKSAKEILARRREFIRAVQKHFELSDADLKSITQRDIRLMNNAEFKTYLDNIRMQSAVLAKRRQARNQLNAQIREKELNIEPLRQALGLPPINQMTVSQLIEFDKTLEPYQKGDVFLSKRKLETINQTDLAGIRTYREAREAFNKKHGTDLKALKAEEYDRLTGNAGLSERNPFYKVMIEEFYKKLLVRDSEYLEIENKINSIAKKFKTGIVGKIIPQQKNIVKWFEAEDKSTVELTPAEAEAIKFMQAEWIKARDYLIEQNALKKGISSDNYFTHVRRTFLETVKEDGLVTAVKEIFKQQEQDQQIFEILDQETGQVLPLQKFFQFALNRTGGLKPSSNVVGAFLTYMRTFKKKQAIDESFPLIMTYADAFTPPGTTKEGLLLSGSLKKFVKEWLNNQKGRRATLIMKQGGKGEVILNLIKRGIMLLDLGLNLTVNAATQVGEQAVQFQLLGNKAFVKGKIRAKTRKGQRIIKKYRSLIGKNPWTQLIEPARKIGDRINEAIFIIFRDANYGRTRNALLGMMTPEEYQNETLTPERLAEIRLAISRYGMVDGAGSIIGATPEAKVFTMYKSWALPIIGSQIRNIGYLTSYIKSKGTLNKAEARRAVIEAGRIAEVVLFVSIIAMAVGIDQDDDSLFGKLKKRAYQEAMTIVSALSPKTLFTTPRLITFLDELAQNLTSLMKLEAYEATKFGEYKKGDLKGLNALKKQLTPRALRQLEKDSTKTEQDVAKEILDDLKSGRLDEAAAEEKLNNELKKIESKKKEERFLLPANEYAKDLLDRLKSGEVTEAEAEKELDKYLSQDEETFDSKDETSFIGKVKVYAEALGTDPVTAFGFIFQGEKIRRTDNGAIIVWRGKTTDSNESREFAVKKRKEFGATENLKLDHTIPLQLGGGNSDSNLKLVLEEDWKSYTPVENYLGNKLRAGQITKKEAQKLIKDFKAGKISAEDIIE